MILTAFAESFLKIWALHAKRKKAQPFSEQLCLSGIKSYMFS